MIIPKTLSVLLVQLATLATLTTLVSAGPVNNANSFPVAIVNDQGSTLTIGDLKILMRWVGPNSTYINSVDSATTIKLRSSRLATTDDIFTGGIASVSSAAASSAFSAIACSDIETQVFNPVRSLAAPGGSWTVLPTLPNTAGTTNLRRCTITSDGTVAEYFPATGSLVISSNSTGTLNQRKFVLGTKFTFTTIGSTHHYLMTSANRVILINSKGDVAVLQAVSSTNLSLATMVNTGLRSPFTLLQSYTRFSSNQNYILRADSGRSEIATLVPPTSTITTSLTATTAAPTSLKISPCGDTEACGVSLSQTDNSWVVSGYWGTFVGIAGNTATPPKRFALPLGIETSFGIAFGHQKLGGVFVYLGTDDGDLGIIPAAVLGTTALVDSGNVNVNSWTVWKRRDGATARTFGPGEQVSHDEYNVLNAVAPNQDVSTSTAETEVVVPLTSGFEYTSLSTTSPSILSRRQYSSKKKQPLNRSLIMTTHRGRLPRNIPQDWVQWEPSISFQAPLTQIQPLAVNTTAANIPIPWWSTKIGVANSWNLVKQANVTPSQVHVAIIDSGVVFAHPWFASASSSYPYPSFYTNPNETPSNKLDDDQNGFVDDIIGYDFVNESGNVTDKFGHGTMCSGYVAGRNPEDPDFPLAPARNARLTMVRGLDGAGKSNSIDLARSIAYVVKMKPQIVSCSWGGGSDTQGEINIKTSNGLTP
jgi:hypothetical protein